VTLVLLHAYPLDSRFWKPQIDALANGFEILAPDLLGFGAAAAGPDEIPIDLAADAVIRLLDQHHVEKAAIAGCSRGGYIALSIARRYPERVCSLILMDTRATPADPQEKQQWTQTIDRLNREGIGVLPEIMLPRLLSKHALENRPDLVARLTEIILSQQPAAAAAAARGMANRPDQTPALKDIQIPTIAIAGVHDAAFESTKAIAAAVPGAKFLEIPNAGHVCNLEQPELVNQAIRTFLSTNSKA
jgi:pimeloyl-ACP methyl ester carboxylesterase